jgi:hypothetical protein
LIGRRNYKSDERAKQTQEKEVARREIVRGLCSSAIEGCYGVRVELPEEMAEVLVEDQMADTLDAVLCAVQAGWAYLQRESGYGIPVECESMEGWIVDPFTLAGFLCAPGMAW